MTTIPLRIPQIVFSPIILELLTLKYLRDRKKKKEAEKKAKSGGSKSSGSKKPSGKAKLKFKLSVFPMLT
jgi:hypothetical protein